MTKRAIINHINGTATEQENQMVLEWLDADGDHLKYYLHLKNLVVLAAMKHEAASPEEMLESLEIMEYTPKNTHNRGFRYWRYWAAAACILLLLCSNVYLLVIHNSTSDNISTSIAPEQSLEIETLSNNNHTLYTNKGVKGFVELPDGSSVWLNSDSKITYPDRFLGDIREVSISGEAYFKVAKDSIKPMIVNTNRGFQIKVLGTEFNVRSYENEKSATATLLSGSIAILKNDAVVTTLKENQSYREQQRGAPTVKVVNTENKVAWKEGILIFESTSLSDVIKELERWYGTEFIVTDPSVYDCSFTAQFKSESIGQIMEMLKFCTFIDYSIKDNRVWLRKK